MKGSDRNNFQPSDFEDKTLLEKDDDRTLLEEKPETEDRTLIEDDAPEPVLESKTVWTEGQIIDGLYKVENIVKGGMGIIYFIDHLKWGIKLVVKSPLEELLTGENRRRFIQEAETWVDLGKHPNIATAFYVRELNNIPRIFIEYADGGSLTSRLKEKKLEDLSEIIDVAIQFCHGMIYAHSKGLIHRDIKPDNVLMMEDGTVKITDFGLVKTKTGGFDDKRTVSMERPKELTPAEWQTLTHGGAVGTPPYMSPEQWTDSDKVDKRSDIYSFGVMLYEMVCGRRPFIKDPGNPQPPVIAYQIMHRFNPPPDPSEFYTAMPADLKGLLLKCLEKEPEKRYDTFIEIKNALIKLYYEISGKEYDRDIPGEAELKADDLNNRALSYMDLGKKEEALKFLEEAIKLDPNSLPANINLILLLTEENRDIYENISLRFKSIREGNPHSPVPFYYESIYEMERGNPLTALELIDKALEIDSRNPDMLNFKGVILKNLELYKESQISFINTLREDRENLIYQRNYGAVFYYMGKYEDSCKAFEELLKTNPYDREIKIDIAVALTGKKEFKKAINLLKEVLKGEPENLRACIYLGEILGGIKTFVPTFTETESVINRDMSFQYLRKAFALAPGYRRIKSDLQEIEKKFGINISKDKSLPLSEKIKTAKEIQFPCTGKIETLKSQKGRIKGVSFLPGGDKAAISTSQSNLELWDLKEFKKIQDYSETARRGVYESFGIDVSPGGNYIAAGYGDKTIKIWDREHAGLLAIYEGHTNIVKSLKYTSDGKYILSSDTDGNIKMWDIEDGKIIKTFENIDTTYCISLSSDDKYMATGTRKKGIQIWNLEGGEICKNLSDHEGSILSLSFSPDNKYVLSGSDDRTIKLWDFEREKCIKTFEGHKGSVESIEFFPEGNYFISGDSEGVLKIWDIEKGLSIRTINAHKEVINSIKISHQSGHILTGSKDGTMKYIALPDKGNIIYPPLYIKEYLVVKPRSVRETFKDAESYEKLITEGENFLKNRNWEKAMKAFLRAQEIPGYARDGKVLSCIYKAGKGGVSKKIKNIWLSGTIKIDEGINKIAVLNENTIIISSEKDNIIREIDLEKLTCLSSLSGHEGKILDMDCSSDSCFIVSTDQDSKVKIWDMTDKSEITSISMKTIQNGVAVFPGNEYIATGGGTLMDSTVKIWNLKTKECLRTYQGHSRPISTIKIFREGSNFITCSFDTTAKIWSLEKEKAERTFSEHTLPVNNIALAPKEKLFASASDDKTVKIWNINNNKSIFTLSEHEGEVTSVDFSPDGRYVISGSKDKTVMIWNVVNGKCLRVLRGHTDEVRNVKFTPGGRYIVTSGRDNQLQLWELDWDWEFPANKKTADNEKKESQSLRIIKPDGIKPSEIEKQKITISSKPEKPVTVTGRLQRKNNITRNILPAILILAVIYFFYSFMKPVEWKMEEKFSRLLRNYPLSIISMDEKGWRDETDWWLAKGKFYTTDAKIPTEFLIKKLRDKKTETKLIGLKLLEKMYNKSDAANANIIYDDAREDIVGLIGDEVPAVRIKACEFTIELTGISNPCKKSVIENDMKKEELYWQEKTSEIEQSKTGDTYKCTYCHDWSSEPPCSYAKEKPYEIIIKKLQFMLKQYR